MSLYYIHNDITEKIIKAAYKVYQILGSGFLEKVYENALTIEMGKLGLSANPQRPIKVFYDNQIVGDFIADFVVEDKVIVEIKAVTRLNQIHEVQLVNYLKATAIEVGLLINFGDDITIKRKLLTS